MRDVFSRTADCPIERYAILLGQIIALLGRVNDRENSAAIVKRISFTSSRFSTANRKSLGMSRTAQERSMSQERKVSWLAE